jgi:hypothetical protein
MFRSSISAFAAVVVVTASAAAAVPKIPDAKLRTQAERPSTVQDNCRLRWIRNPLSGDRRVRRVCQYRVCGTRVVGKAIACRGETPAPTRPR